MTSQGIMLVNYVLAFCYIKKWLLRASRLASWSCSQQLRDLVGWFQAIVDATSYQWPAKSRQLMNDVEVKPHSLWISRFGPTWSAPWNFRTANPWPPMTTGLWRTPGSKNGSEASKFRTTRSSTSPTSPRSPTPRTPPTVSPCKSPTSTSSVYIVWAIEDYVFSLSVRTLCKFPQDTRKKELKCGSSETGKKEVRESWYEWNLTFVQLPRRKFFVSYNNLTSIK